MPNVHGPGDAAHNGTVQCAMTQVGGRPHDPGADEKLTAFLELEAVIRVDTKQR